ncbi:MAG: hypothetical protein R3F41_05285 [Gammaproteobacteria bacterium]|nr:hypothetical protein [Pseudomonadales bacterium]MCP5345283.1 hypothetical protein [Pseudomonadales bacterium]
MRILTVLLLLIFASSVQAQGFLDSIRRRVNDTVNNAVDEVRSVTNQEIGDVNQDVSDSTDGIVDDVVPQVPSTVGISSTGISGSTTSSTPAVVASGQGGMPANLFWGTPSGNDLLAINQEIQGLRVGMPAMYVDQILKDRGYESNAPQFYFKQQKTDDGQIIRTQRIQYLTVEPSQQFIDELPEGELKDRVLQAQQVVSENQQTVGSSSRQPSARELRIAGTDARDISARRSASAPAGPRSLELVYLIQYDQIYNQDVRKFDLETMISQARGAFGPSTFPDDIYRNGMAFRSSPDTTLIYHDASLLSPEYKNSLIEAVPDRGMGHREAVFDALKAPCGGPENPWGASGGGGCPNGWLDAIPDNFDKQMELARAVLSPYMRINLSSSGAGITTRLEWSYLQGERGMRERNAEQEARDNAPAAQLDF